MPTPVVNPTQTPTVTPETSPGTWETQWTSPDRICPQQVREGASPEIPI